MSYTLVLEWMPGDLYMSAVTARCTAPTSSYSVVWLPPNKVYQITLYCGSTSLVSFLVGAFRGKAWSYMKKRLLSICLVLALCLTCVPSALALGDGRFSGGDGTVNAPYEIKTADDLFALADAVNNGMSYEGEYFSLTNDINLDGQAWTPIGDRLNQDEFLGTFDGNNRTVSGLCVEGAYGSAGLFGFVGMSSWNTTAEVKNLNVVGSVSVERTPATFYVAGIAGFVGQGAAVSYTHLPLPTILLV